jgi:hypothetical protein
MLRHSAPPLLAGAAVALVEVAAGDHRLPALAAAAVLALAAWGGIARGREVGQWALRKTLEVAFWMDDVDRPAPARPAP